MVPAAPPALNFAILDDGVDPGIHVHAWAADTNDMFVHLILGIYEIMILRLSDVVPDKIMEFEVTTAANALRHRLYY